MHSFPTWKVISCFLLALTCKNSGQSPLNFCIFCFAEILLYAFQTPISTPWIMGIWGYCVKITFFMKFFESYKFVNHLNSMINIFIFNKKLNKYRSATNTWSLLQASPFCKIVREVLVELELPHILHRCIFNCFRTWLHLVFESSVL